MPKLFTYGTLAEPEIQKVVLGEDKTKTLRPTAVRNFKLGIWTNEKGSHFLAAFPFLGSIIKGHTFEVNEEQLFRCDVYEGYAYRRVQVMTANGEVAFMYISSDK